MTIFPTLPELLKANDNSRGELMLELKNISFEVPEEASKEILHNVNLTLEDGKFVAITGPNGGGKSTLAKIIAGLEQPSSGSIYFNGADITGASVTDRANMGIGYAFQNPVRFKGIRVKDLIRFAVGMPISVSEACEYLSEVGLCARDYIEREVNGSLSGGELKRIEIATVLARKSSLSIFDEPEAGIDLWSFQNLIEVFERMQAENSQNSILVISHQERILNIADEIIVLSGGRVTEHGPRGEVLPGLMGTDSAVSRCDKYEMGGRSK